MKDTVSSLVTMVTVNYAGGKIIPIHFYRLLFTKGENAVPSQVINLWSFAGDITDVTFGHTLYSVYA